MRNDHLETPDEFGLDYENISLTTKDFIKIKAYLILAKQSNVTLIYFHANAGNFVRFIYLLKGHRIPIALKLRQTIKCNIFMLSYRGYGPSEGSPTEKGLKIDSQVDFLTLDSP